MRASLRLSTGANGQEQEKVFAGLFLFLLVSLLACWSLFSSEVVCLPPATTYMAGEHLCLVKIKSAGAKLLVEEPAMFVAN